MKNVLYFLLITFLWGCSHKLTDNNEFELKAESEKVNRFWINKRYLNCLEKSSPCSCLYENDDFSMVILNSLNSIETEGHGVENTSHKIYTYKDKKYILFEKDTLQVSFNSEKNLVIGDDQYVTDDDWRDNDYVNQINAGVLKRYDNQVKEVYGNKSLKSLTIYCNPYSGVHYLSLGENCKNEKIIDYKNDSIYIYDFLNSCAPKSIDFKIEKKLLIKFKR